jgi:cytochrome c peroxidase
MLHQISRATSGARHTSDAPWRSWGSQITGCPDPSADPTKPSTTPFVILTTDPGKGLVTGLCSDVARTKGPILRGLAARAPYFHNGAARNLSELLDFYNQRFQMNLTDGEKEQLKAFLNSL